MSDVRSEVFRKILLQLPAVSLFRFRSVCTAWLGIIDDPSFIKDHSNSQAYSHTLLARSETGAPIFSFSLDSLHFVVDFQKIDATKVKQLIRHGLPRLQSLFHVASCNGLLLLSHEYTKKIWAIWNPLTGDCHELPRPKAGVHSDAFGIGFGFGYDGDADDYKVVRVDRLEYMGKVVMQTLVYSLKSESWSMIEDCPGEISLFDPGVFFNGTLYWQSRNMIIALDIRTESYSQLPLPPESKNRIDDYRLDALDGCLILSIPYRHCFDGWVMKDDAAEKSWIKLFSLQPSFCKISMDFKLVAYLKGKQQVLLQNRECFWWFDIGNNSVLNFSVHCFSRISSSKICPGSLVRLRPRGSAIESDVTARTTTTKKRKRNSKKPYASVKICVRNAGDLCCTLDGYCRADCCDCSLKEEGLL